MKLRTGYTTGACAAAAAKAAVTLLCGGEIPEAVEIALPEGNRARFPVLAPSRDGASAQASVRKDAGDDPDVTNQAAVTVAVAFAQDGGVQFAAGEGVGIVTKPGLSIPPGEPAINPVPRRMIREAIREVTPRGVRVTVSIPGGRELAARTFNPRLGIEGGLSILGTTGIVKPFSVPALTASLQCALDVAAACGVRAPVLVPGNIGERAALKNLRLDAARIVQVSNHWGFMLDAASRMPFQRLLALGHPGKLAKLADGEWDTHSSNSPSAVGVVSRIAEKALGHPVPESATVEGIFEALAPGEKSRVGNALAAAVRRAIVERIGGKQPLAVLLVNMAGEPLGAEGDLSPWK
ncbi:MAG: cobalt-precorrin-5B (C(1))-methyltransferase CbiD [Chthoniobacteraceae bacterium]|nr:cobalt-precorrin-5B (C(1))-methyltransferase CbiD [Chthoniobacteraceae bacterium]